MRKGDLAAGAVLSVKVRPRKVSVISEGFSSGRLLTERSRVSFLLNSRKQTREELKRNNLKMKPLIKSLSILAIGGILTGLAYAGPGDAYLGYPAVSMAKAHAKKEAQYETIALFRIGVKATAERAKAEKTPILSTGNPRTPAAVMAPGSR